MSDEGKIGGKGKLRWNCERDGCFNKILRPKLEVFYDCFPGGIRFGDVDGIVEINNNFLMLEWKSRLGPLPTGQRIMYERLTTDPRWTVVVIVGSAETMVITDIAVCSFGEVGGWEKSSLDDVKARTKRWVTRSLSSR